MSSDRKVLMCMSALTVCFAVITTSLQSPYMFCSILLSIIFHASQTGCQGIYFTSAYGSGALKVGAPSFADNFGSA